MADFYSQEIAQLNKTGNSRVLPNVLSGDVRQYFFTVEADDLEDFSQATDKIVLTRIPSRARILGIALKAASFSTGGELSLGLQGHDGSGEYDFGEADDPDFLVSGLTATAAVDKELVAGTETDAFGYETKKEVDVTLTVDAGTVPVSGLVVKGYVLVVID